MQFLLAFCLQYFAVKTEVQAFLQGFAEAHSCAFTCFQTIMLHQVNLRRRQKDCIALVQLPHTSTLQLCLNLHPLFPLWNEHNLSQFDISVILFSVQEGNSTQPLQHVGPR